MNETERPEEPNVPNVEDDAETNVETVGDEHPTLNLEVGDDPAAEPAAEPTVEEKLAAALDRNLRLQAELQNTLTRKSREMTEERKYAGLALMKDLLPVLDNIDRAIEAAEKTDGDSSGLLDGFKLVRQQLASVLSQQQCEAIGAVGEPFDPSFHEAILQQPSDEHAEGAVMMVTQAGYKLHDRVVRPAQVIVSSGPA